MERRFLKVGSLFNDTTKKQQIIASAINALQWFDLNPKLELPFSQGMAIQTMIRQMGNNPDQVAHGIFYDGIALLAVRNNYSKGKVRRATLYAVDVGDEVINVAADEETEQDVLTKNQARVEVPQ